MYALNATPRIYNNNKKSCQKIKLNATICNSLGLIDAFLPKYTIA